MRQGAAGVRKRILVLRYRFIGDTVLTVPFLRNLRAAEPDAHIAWVVAPGSSEVVKGIPYVDELIYWDPVTIHADSRGTHKTLCDKIRFIRALRSQNFDKVYVLKRSFSSAMIAILSGARERVGFDTEGRGFLLTKRVQYRHDQHEMQNFLDVLRADGVTVSDDYLEFWSTPEEDAAAGKLLADAGISAAKEIVALHPFASNPHRGWPFEDFASLAALLRAQGFVTLVLGAPSDRNAFECVRDLFGQETVDLVGRCNLRVTMALLKRCALFVGNDSGIMHLAAAANIPMVALFGPQSPVKFGPWSSQARAVYRDFPCSPCKQKFFTECEPSPRMRPACVEAITVDDVFREVVQFVSKDKEGDYE
ncbi:MAG: lipopolysaccharide heptosyltransferase II [Deltaproteobacteria bacterium]|nr:lipopolysaccharide heptosyltransferase II [Deltaproteobacteria bacterium]TLN03564.1 MAG: lipopolysaccharide heptosyltransferase II [bacterium]